MTNRLSNELNSLNPPKMGGSSRVGAKKKMAVAEVLLELPTVLCRRRLSLQHCLYRLRSRKLEGLKSLKSSIKSSRARRFRKLESSRNLVAENTTLEKTLGLILRCTTLIITSATALLYRKGGKIVATFRLNCSECKFDLHFKISNAESHLYLNRKLNKGTRLHANPRIKCKVVLECKSANRMQDRI